MRPSCRRSGCMRSGCRSEVRFHFCQSRLDRIEQLVGAGNERAPLGAAVRGQLECPPQEA